MCPDKGILSEKLHSYGQVPDNNLLPALPRPLCLGVGTSAVSECCDRGNEFRARIFLRFSDPKPVLTTSRLGTYAEVRTSKYFPEL